jgi:hypothetical protein
MCFKKILCGFQDREIEFLAYVQTSLSTVQTLISQVTSVWTPISVQKLRTVQGCIRLDVSATRLDAIQCSTSKMISLADTDLGKQLQTSGRQVYIV